MTDIALIRHGPTDWNAEKRLQGRTDRPLSEEGRKTVRSWALPAQMRDFGCIASPLRRAVETAEILTKAPVATDSRITEMAFGDWEGARLSDLRAEHGEAMARNEARGLDFTPPGGESPRMVIDRLKGFWCDVLESKAPIIAVCHNGVIRATYAFATGWDMTSKPQTRLRNGHAHLFSVGGAASITVKALNIPLARSIK